MVIRFLAARWDEEEAEALKQPDFEEEFSVPPWGVVKDTETSYPCAEFLRIAKARVLADIAAKRRVLDLRADLVDRRSALAEAGLGTSHTEAAIEAYDHVLHLFAQVYADHPDYPRQER